MPNFKYQSGIDELIKEGYALPSLHVPHNKFACRYVFDYEHFNNHKPVFIQKPARIQSSRDIDNLTTSGYALSCFEKEESAVQQFKDLQNNNKNIYKSIGNALCIGILEEKDGLITDPNRATTHFDLYEFSECDLGSKFTIRQKLV